MERSFELGLQFRRGGLRCPGQGLIISNYIDDIPRFRRACDDCSHSSGGSEASGDNFRGHSSSAERGAGSGYVDRQSGDICYYFDGQRGRVDTGVFVVEAVDVGHEEEVVCLHHSGGYGREGIVVAKFDFLEEVMRFSLRNSRMSKEWNF